MGRVEGKVAIVTGAASGLGAADARMLAHEGARVVLTDVDEATGSALARELDALDIEQTTTERWRRTLAVRLDGTFFGCRAAIPAMAAGT